MHAKLLRRKQHVSTTLIIQNPDPIWGLSWLKDLSRTHCQDIGQGEAAATLLGYWGCKIGFPFLGTSRTEGAECFWAAWKMKPGPHGGFFWKRGLHHTNVHRCVHTHTQIQCNVDVHRTDMKAISLQLSGDVSKVLTFVFFFFKILPGRYKPTHALVHGVHTLSSGSISLLNF